MYQLKNVQKRHSFRDNNYRRKLAAKLSMVMSSMLLMSNLCLLLLLKHNPSFTYHADIILKKYTTETILSIFLLPAWGLAMLSSYLYGRKIRTKETTKEGGMWKTTIRHYLPVSFSALIFIGVFVLSGMMFTGLNFKEGT